MFSFLTGALAEDAGGEIVEEAAEIAEAVAKETSGWFQDAVSKFGKTPLEAWITFGAILALGVVLLVITRSGKKWNTRMIAFGALSIALSFVRSCIRLFRNSPSDRIRDCYIRLCRIRGIYSQEDRLLPR